MKKLYLLVVVVCAFFCSKAYSQTKYKTAEERAADLTKIMTCELGLLDDEVPKVNAVNLHAALRMDSLYKQYEGKPGKIKSKGEVVDKEHDVLLRRTLTASQYSFYLKIKEEDIDAMKKTAACRPDKKKK